MSSPVVTIIPAKVDKRNQPIGEENQTKRRVAAYARVSTELEEQETSFAAQVDYYTKHIEGNPEWVMVEVYSDEGISATTTKNRDGFNRMIADALAGKIDLILTKSISRFARNTVDTLTTVRKLKEKGVEVYFQKENIYTFDSKGELLITIMSSLAQEESRSISENVTWGHRKRMADGKVTMSYKHFLGYKKGADGTPEVVEEEAEIIREIYSLFLDGATYREIAANLTAQGIPTPSKKAVWSMSTVRSILQNEKYSGKALLQKQYTVDFLTKKTKPNEGELPQYLINDSHPAIVSPDTYELVQAEIRRRATFGKQISGSGLFVGRIVCGDCGKMFGAKVWNSTTKWRSVVWRCNHKYKGHAVCHTPHLIEDEIRQVFIKAWNAIITDKTAYIKQYETEIAELADTSDMDAQIDSLKSECARIVNQAEECRSHNSTNKADQAVYRLRYDKLIVEYDTVKAQYETLVEEKKLRISRRAKIKRFLDTLSKNSNVITAFDEALWKQAVEVVKVRSRDEVIVRFNSGTEISVSATKRAK